LSCFGGLDAGRAGCFSGSPWSERDEWPMAAALLSESAGSSGRDTGRGRTASAYIAFREVDK
jgi:hypothetical protein